MRFVEHAIGKKSFALGIIRLENLGNLDRQIQFPDRKRNSSEVGIHGAINCSREKDIGKIGQ